MVAAVAELEWPVWIVAEQMAQQMKDTILGAFRQLLRPLVRILLRNGVSYDEFAETSKTVFVEVAERDFPRPDAGDPLSQIAIVTGLSRKEAARITTAIADGSGVSTANLNRVGRILAGWHQDPEFTGPYGLPLELTTEGPLATFPELVERYCPDEDAGTVLDELRRVGVASLQPGGRVRVLTRAYIPGSEDPASFQFMGLALRDLAETLDSNLNGNNETGYFERRVWTPAGIDPRDMPEFDGLVNTKGQEFLELLDNFLTSKETEAEQARIEKKIRVGVGVFLFSDANRTFKEQ
jgi:hypothetical protein